MFYSNLLILILIFKRMGTNAESINEKDEIINLKKKHSIFYILFGFSNKNCNKFYIKWK